MAHSIALAIETVVPSQWATAGRLVCLDHPAMASSILHLVIALPV